MGRRTGLAVAGRSPVDVQEPKPVGIGDDVVVENATARDVEEQRGAHLSTWTDHDGGMSVDRGDPCLAGVFPECAGFGKDRLRSPNSQCPAARKGLRVGGSHDARVEEPDQTIGVTLLGGNQEGFHHSLRLPRVSRWTASALAQASACAACQLLGRSGSRFQDVRYLFERQSEHVVKDQGYALRWRKLVKDDHECGGQITRKKRYFLWSIASALGHRERFNVLLRYIPSPAQGIETQPADDRRQPCRHVSDVAGVGMAILDPCVLYGIFGVGFRPEQAERDGQQMWSFTLERGESFHGTSCRYLSMTQAQGLPDHDGKP